MSLAEIVKDWLKFERLTDGGVRISTRHNRKVLKLTSKDWCELVHTMSVDRNSSMAGGMIKYMHMGD